MTNEKGLEELSWGELERSVEEFIAADGPNTEDLATDEFLALWKQFEEERRQRVVEVEGEIEGEDVHLTLAPSSVSGVEIEGHEIRLPDGTRIVFHFRSAQRAAA
jgi:hypothetical protein